MNLRWKSLEECNEFAREIEGVEFDSLDEAKLHEFASKALADRINRRRKLKDQVKSREAKKQQASELGRDQLSRSLKKFHQTAIGKRLRARVQQMRKDGRFDKFESVRLLTQLQGCMIQEATYSRGIIEEAHTELCVERLHALMSPIVDGIMDESISHDALVVLMNVGELAESLDCMLNIEEGSDGSVFRQVLVIDEDEDDPCWDGYEQVGMKDKNGKKVPNCVPKDEDGSMADLGQLPTRKVGEMLLIDEAVDRRVGKVFESLDSMHGQTSFKTFDLASDDEVRPGVLRTVRGPAFFLDSISRNNRFYSAELWRKAVADEEFQERLARRVVYGTIGHDVEIDEEAIRKGLISHIVTDVKIDEKAGIGFATYDIFNSASGRELNTLIEAQSGIKTSTRAYGTLKRGARPAGLPSNIDVIDPDKFKLAGVDFVIDPGFLGSETY